MNIKPYSVFLLFACASLVSCVSPAQPEAMIPESVALQHKFHQSVSTVVSGGQSTNPLWTSQVANEDFQTALQDSIEKHGLFSQVLRSNGGDYVLDVRLVRLGQPIIGLNMTVTADVEWRLNRGSSGSRVWEERIVRKYTATVGQAFAGVKRLRLANEGAIRENIKAALEKISRLSL